MRARLGLVAALGSSLVGGCTSSSQPLYEEVLDSQMLDVGGGGEAQTVRLSRGRVAVELEIPGDVVPMRARVQVSLVQGVPKRGRTPVNDTGVLVGPAQLTFAQPVRVRQRVPPPPPRRTYVTVVIPDGGDTFEARTPARMLAPVDPAAPDDGELWEGDGTGSGLWGLALE